MPTKAPAQIPATASSTLRVNCTRFIESLKGGKDAVYSVLLKSNHGAETKNLGDWKTLLESYRTAPVPRPKSARVRKIR